MYKSNEKDVNIFVFNLSFDFVSVKIEAMTSQIDDDKRVLSLVIDFRKVCKSLLNTHLRKKIRYQLIFCLCYHLDRNRRKGRKRLGYDPFVVMKKMDLRITQRCIHSFLNLLFSLRSMMYSFICV